MISTAVFRIIVAITQEPLETDRPDFTESSLVVPKGTIQVETGATYSNGVDGRSVTAPETLVRWGISDRWEGRIEIPNYVVAHGGKGRASGFDSPTLGAKYQIGPCKGADSAIIGSVSIPSSRGDFADRKSVLELKLCGAREMKRDRSLSAMLAWQWDGDVSRYMATLSLGQDLTNTLGAFVEVASEFGAGTTTSHTLHAGITGKCGLQKQWDVHFGADASRPKRTAFLGVGYAVRF